MKKVLIIGGGIGGLTLALALNKAGIPCSVFERAAQLKEVGAGLGLWANAVKVLDRLGIGEQIREIGQPLKTGEINSATGQTLSRINIAKLANKNDAACYLVHRAELQEVLAKNLPVDSIKTDYELINIKETDRGVTASFKHQPDAEGTLLVGADGINSIVRAHLWGKEKPRYSGQTCFRGVVNSPASGLAVLREIQGAGKRFGICPLSKNRIYWFAAINALEELMIPPAERRQFLLAEFKNWRWQIPELIVAQPSEKILQNDLVDRVPINKWSKGAITLLGDAAHPTTPNFGQGACMAIEEAMILTRNLLARENLPDALRSYEQSRIKRTSSIVNQSWTFGILAKWKNPFAVQLRQLIIRTTPEFVAQKMMRQQIGFDAGSLAHD